MSMTMTDQIGDNTTRAMALSTQQSHMRRMFKPYVYRGNGYDVVTPDARMRCNGETWCYCTTCTRRNLKQLSDAGAPALTRSTL